MTRTVRANLGLTLDGRYNGPGGPSDLGAIVPYATTEVGRDHLTRIFDGATTALLGRGSAQGFMGYWPPVADDENADPRERGYASWLVGAEKIVLSTTLTEAPWERTRVVNAPAAEVVGQRLFDDGLPGSRWKLTHQRPASWASSPSSMSARADL